METSLQNLVTGDAVLLKRPKYRGFIYSKEIIANVTPVQSLIVIHGRLFFSNGSLRDEELYTNEWDKATIEVFNAQKWEELKEEYIKKSKKDNMENLYELYHDDLCHDDMQIISNILENAKNRYR